MHPCLQVLEILTNIFESREDHNPYKRILKPYVLALVCKTFSEVALDMLWRWQGDIRPLLKCFPQDLWEESKGTSKTFYFTRPMTSHDWERFQHYGCRVKSLSVPVEWSIPPSKRVLVDPGVFQALDACRDLVQQTGPLLKNLRDLSWGASNSPSLWNVRLFLGSTLRSVGLSLFSTVSNQRPCVGSVAALAAVKSKCPNLQSLRIHCSEGSGNLTSALSELVCDLRSVRIVRCGPIALTGGAFNCLAWLPSLRQLQLTLFGGECVESYSMSSSQHPFQGLEELELVVDDLSLAIGFVEVLLATPLKKICVSVDNPPSAPLLRQFFSALLAHCLPTVLAEIRVDHDTNKDHDEFGDTATPHLLDGHTLEPLFGFANLHTLCIQTQISTRNVDDALMKDIATAWPQLRKLDLATTHGKRWPSQVTVNGLLAFVQCPKLNSLSLGINACLHHATTPERPGGGFSNQSIRYLSVARSPISNPCAVAAVLSDIFPGLNDISAWDDYDDEIAEEEEQHRMWGEFRRMYGWFVVIRKQERQWASSSS